MNIRNRRRRAIDLSANRVSRSLAASLLAVAFLTGCLDPSPGTHRAVEVPLSSRINPACRGPVHLLVLDEDAIAKGQSPNLFSGEDVNDAIAAVGLRSQLPYFLRNDGKEILIPSGEMGDEGWFAPKTVRVAWREAGPSAGDGLRNYLEAGPGLGRPDAKGNSESLLAPVPDLTPLRATGLAKLEGKSVCALVRKGDVGLRYSTLVGSLAGAYLGKVAFQVLGTVVSPKASQGVLPSVRIRILDADAVCEEPITPYLDAPVINSGCSIDTHPPECPIRASLLVEPWDVFDPAKWLGDGDQVVSGGFFSAREGARSAFADWTNPCPIPLGTTGGIRFSNRVQLVSPQEEAYNRSGALFLINGANDGTFDNFTFLHVGYTARPSKVFVELFGSSGGEDFDQLVETQLAFRTSLLFNLDLWITRDSYEVSVDGETVDTVALNKPLAGVGMFEVGVEQLVGLSGFIDRTSITKTCRTECRHRTRRPTAQILSTSRPAPSPCNKNPLIRMAKSRVRTMANPPQGLVILSKMKESTGCDGK